jgi:hypothetical protein
MAYVIPTNELTLTDIKNFKEKCLQAGLEEAMSHGLARTMNELTVREALPFTDFGAGAVGWTIEQYRNPVIAAAGWGSVFDAGALPANVPQLANNKVAVFYKFTNYTVAPSLIGLRFRLGQQGATTRAVFQAQLEIGSKLEPDVYLSEPIVYGPNDWVYIEGYYDLAVAALGEAFAFKCYIMEPVGGVVS